MQVGVGRDKNLERRHELQAEVVEAGNRAVGSFYLNVKNDRRESLKRKSS
jgi:hypothetical protein